MTCRYLQGEPKDRRFCGRPRLLGSAYCPEHHVICYRFPGETDAEHAERTRKARERMGVVRVKRRKWAA